MRIKRWVNKSARRLRVGAWMTWGVILLQAALLLTLWVTPTWLPPRVQFFELIWAWMQRPTFYPLVALLAGGPPLTVIAWHAPGGHRLVLVTAWVVFLCVMATQFDDRCAAMIRVILWEIRG